MMDILNRDNIVELLRCLERPDLTQDAKCVREVFGILAPQIVQHEMIRQVMTKDIACFIPVRRSNIKNLMNGLAILFGEYSHYPWEGRRLEVISTQQYFNTLSSLLKLVIRELIVLPIEDVQKDRLGLRFYLILLIVLGYTRTMEIEKLNLITMQQKWSLAGLMVVEPVMKIKEGLKIDFFTGIFPLAGRAILSAQFNLLFRGLSNHFPTQAFIALKKEAIALNLDIDEPTLTSCVGVNRANLDQSLSFLCLEKQSYIQQFEKIVQSFAGELLQGNERKQIGDFIRLLKAPISLKESLNDPLPLKASHTLDLILSRHKGALTYFFGQPAILLWKKANTDPLVMQSLDKLSRRLQGLIGHLVNRRYAEIAPKTLREFIRLLEKQQENLRKSKKSCFLLELVLISSLSFKDQTFLLDSRNVAYFDLLYQYPVESFLFLFKEGSKINRTSLQAFEKGLIVLTEPEIEEMHGILVRGMIDTVMRMSEKMIIGAPSLMESALKVLINTVLSSRDCIESLPHTSIRRGYS